MPADKPQPYMPPWPLLFPSGRTSDNGYTVFTAAICSTQRRWCRTVATIRVERWRKPRALGMGYREPSELDVVFQINCHAAFL